MSVNPDTDVLNAAPPMSEEARHNEHQNGHAHLQLELNIVCGPLINYRHTSNELSDEPIWHGSVLIVTPAAQSPPTLHLRCVDATPQAYSGPLGPFPGIKLYQDPDKAFFRFAIHLPLQDFEAHWEYSFGQSNNSIPKVFIVPSKLQSMRIHFHSCNGFSLGTDEGAWSGPALWNDVIRTHSVKPFHVMIGGGDQIYNDNVRVTGPLKSWTSISNPKKRRDYQFDEALRAKSDEHYYQNYLRWYGMEPFKSANSIIPQINLWDDHDIIDGFGSYTDHFMRCHVFRGIGGVAHK
jgi:hypothetical protein